MFWNGHVKVMTLCCDRIWREQFVRPVQKLFQANVQDWSTEVRNDFDIIAAA